MTLRANGQASFPLNAPRHMSPGLHCHCHRAVAMALLACVYLQCTAISAGIFEREGTNPRLLDVSLNASESPLMRNSALSQYAAPKPVTCFHSLHVVTAYIYRVMGDAIPPNIEIEVGMSSSGVVHTPETVCLVKDDALKVVLVGNFSTRYLKSTCNFKPPDLTQLLEARLIEVILVHSHVLGPDILDYARWNDTLINDFVVQNIACRIDALSISQPDNPYLFLMGVSQIRSATSHFRDWIFFHLRLGYDHMVSVCYCDVQGT
jgi:hypothetical protein